VRVNIQGLHKSFATPVLKGVDLQVGEGEILGLVGENGAGKSTLINILCGLLPPSQGLLQIDGEAYSPKNIRDAMRRGISLAAQELSLIDNLSVAENICLKALPARAGRIRRGELRRRAADLLALVGADQVPPDAMLAGLSLAEKQLVELAKALSADAGLLILDEPTAALTGPQAARLHDIIRARSRAGLSVIYVSHRLDDVLEVCDRVAVLRDGEIQCCRDSADLDVDGLIRAMSGVSPPGRAGDAERKLGPLCLEVSGLCGAGLPHPIDLRCHRGEILGIAGLAGAGRSELLEAIYGLGDRRGGRVALLDGDRRTEIHSAHRAARCGIGLIAEDRKSQGIFADKSLAFNSTIAGLDRISGWLGRLLPRREKARTEQLIEALSVRCEGPAQPIGKLSGGNQQKLLLARWIHCDARVLLLDEPTRGVDVGSKLAIHDRLRALRDRGVAIILVSSELEELNALCDNILVLSKRKPAARFRRGDWSNDAILKAAFSEYTRHDPV